MPIFRVPFYKRTTTMDRHVIDVEAPDRIAAFNKVAVRATGEIDFSQKEAATERVEKEGEVLSSTFAKMSPLDDIFEVPE